MRQRKGEERGGRRGGRGRRKWGEREDRRVREQRDGEKGRGRKRGK